MGKNEVVSTIPHLTTKFRGYPDNFKEKQLHNLISRQPIQQEDNPIKQLNDTAG